MQYERIDRFGNHRFPSSAMPGPSMSLLLPGVSVRNYRTKAISVRNYRIIAILVRNYRTRVISVRNYRIIAISVRNYRIIAISVRNYRIRTISVCDYRTNRHASAILFAVCRTGFPCSLGFRFVCSLQLWEVKVVG
ncbi:unnamed protein product [Trifolium pratense]|uniref:Uncharacterized protein n=1 Tax=Trifolium pratense TaxID=57577 RepID=A0ACB0KX37_TRIPR|nr:unnamed protein product [Trifolium pratense]